MSVLVGLRLADGEALERLSRLASSAIGA
jgi:hypothetical protein